MKKIIITTMLILILGISIVSCSSASGELTNNEKAKIKDTIDLVLSYEKGYDETMKKHISEKNFYVCNYQEFYTTYIGEVDLQEYKSDIVSIRENQERYIVCMKLEVVVLRSDSMTYSWWWKYSFRR